jgi:DNA mismatch endonuclease (patch repair protein)
MQGNRSTGTKPELAVRRAVHALGLRYFANRRPVPSIRRTADLVFPRIRLAVFVDGCFWHGCPEHHATPRTNTPYWSDKIQRNRARDAETDQCLAREGWEVIRIWEHVPPADAALVVAQAVTRRRPGTVPAAAPQRHRPRARGPA